jgi:hypothetical protein
MKKKGSNSRVRSVVLDEKGGILANDQNQGTFNNKSRNHFCGI